VSLKDFQFKKPLKLTQIGFILVLLQLVNLEIIWSPVAKEWWIVVVVGWRRHFTRLKESVAIKKATCFSFNQFFLINFLKKSLGHVAQPDLFNGTCLWRHKGTEVLLVNV